MARGSWWPPQQLKLCNQSEPGFWRLSEENKRWGFSYSYAQENNTLLDWSKLVCTRDALAYLKDLLSKTAFIECCSNEKMNRKWRIYKLTIYIPSSSQRLTYGLQGRWFMGCRTSIEKVQNQVSHVRREHKTSIRRQLVSFLCSCFPFGEESTKKSKNIKKFLAYPSKQWVESVAIGSRDSTWTIFQFLRIC